jgi:Zinc knuckle/CCCH-type zinc finger
MTSTVTPSENNNNDDSLSDTNKRKKMSTPPDSYVCKYCGIVGHWIQQCSKKKGNYKKKQKTNHTKTTHHIPVPGVDPSPENVQEARDMQKIPPPPCYCGSTSRLKKVKRSHQGGETSRAIGNYFFFCAKGKLDSSKCKFAKPALTNELKTQARGPCRILAQTGKCPYGDKCMFRHDVVEGVVMVVVEKDAPLKDNTTTGTTKICKDAADVANHVTVVQPVRMATKKETTTTTTNNNNNNQGSEKASDKDNKSSTDSDDSSGSTTTSSSSSSSSDSDSDSDSYDDQQF